MKRFAILLALATSGLASGLAPAAPSPAAPAPAATPVLKLAVPKEGAYSGAYIDLGEREDRLTLEGLERFTALAGKPLALVALSSDWGNESFPDRQLRIVANYGAVPLVFWSPWDRLPRAGAPAGERRFTFDSILAGRWNGYIDFWASRARAYGHPMLVAWGLEMNGNWFPWSGVLNGGTRPVPGCDGCFAGPETFKKTYRYVVDRVRARGASNVVWVWHTNNVSVPNDPWNDMASYYPGSGYVDWLGLSAYGTQFNDEGWIPVERAIKGHYDEICAIDPTKPVMLAEWGVGEMPKLGNKAQWLDEFFATVPKDYPRLGAAVIWHERWQNSDRSVSNLRINSSPEALEAFRRGISGPQWLARPQLVQ